MRKSQLGEPGGLIGATAHTLVSGGKRIVIDCGGAFEGYGASRVDIAPEGDFLRGVHVDLLILTHAHLDHALYAPRFLRLHPETVALMTRETFSILEILLEDSLKLAKSAYREAERRGDYSLPMPTITTGELENFLSGDQVEFVESGYWIKPWSGWRIGFYSAGHIKGAVSVFIDPPDDRPVYFTGDISSFDQFTVKGVMTPPDEFLKGFFDRRDLVMVTEATNGARDFARSREEEWASLILQIQEVRAREGVVLIPTFACGRTAEMAHGFLHAGITPYVDGMARELLEIEAPELIGKVYLVPRFSRWRASEAFRRDLAKTPGSVIIASSGSLEGGTAVQYAKEILPVRENGVFFVGHIFNQSAAERLLKVERGHTIHLPDFKHPEGVPVNVIADVYNHGFSAHDDRAALVERVERVRPETLIIHHVGESDGVNGFDALSEKIRKEMGNNAPEIIRDEHMREVHLPRKGGCCDD